MGDHVAASIPAEVDAVVRPGRAQPCWALNLGFNELMTYVRPRLRTTFEPGFFFNELSELRTSEGVSDSIRWPMSKTAARRETSSAHHEKA
jgi:hypothetical protein